MVSDGLVHAFRRQLTWGMGMIASARCTVEQARLELGLTLLFKRLNALFGMTVGGAVLDERATLQGDAVS